MHLSKGNLHVHMHGILHYRERVCFAHLQSDRADLAFVSQNCCVPLLVCPVFPRQFRCITSVLDISEHGCLLPREVSSLWCLWGFVVEGRPVTLRFTCTPPTPPPPSLLWCLLQHNEESSSLKLALHACPVRETQPSRTQWGNLAECLQSDHTVHCMRRIQHVMHLRVCWDHRKSRAVWIRVT